MQVTICGLLVLLSFVLCYFKYRKLYVHVSDYNRIGHVVREVYLCVCVAQFSPFVCLFSRVQIFGGHM
jgi:hypothetical protein